jgi:hypothetical protein
MLAGKDVRVFERLSSVVNKSLDFRTHGSKLPDCCLANEEGFIRTATMIDVSTSASSVRINPVGLSRVAAPPLWGL